MPGKHTKVLVLHDNSSSSSSTPAFEEWPHFVDRQAQFRFFLTTELGGEAGLVFLERDVSCYRLDAKTSGYRNALAVSLALALDLECNCAQLLQRAGGSFSALPAFFGTVVYVFTEPKTPEERAASSLLRAERWLLEYEETKREIYPEIGPRPGLSTNLFRLALRDATLNATNKTVHQ